MDSSGAVFLIFLLLLQLVLVVALVLGGMYLLSCFGRAASSLDRLADVAEVVAEKWLEQQNSVPMVPPTVPPAPVVPMQKEISPPQTPTPPTVEIRNSEVSA